MLLPIVVGLPAGVALLLAFVGLLLAFVGAPALPARVWRAVGLAAGFANFGFAAIGLGLGFDVEHIGFQSVQALGWSEALGAELVLGTQGLVWSGLRRVQSGRLQSYALLGILTVLVVVTWMVS